MISSDNIRKFDEVHPPTLRRLTRCILIIVSGMRKMGWIYRFDLNMWSLFKWLSSIADNDTSKKDKSCTGILRGNALELMSFSLLNAEFTPPCHRYFKEFSAAICEAINPNLSWIIRYSAAIAIDVSGLLQYTQANLSNTYVPPELFSVALQLLQDNDDDVRNAAVMALSNVSDVASPVALLSLESSVYCNRRIESNFEKLVCNKLLKECRDLKIWIESRLRSIPDETVKDIFECEDPNPFREQLLDFHLCANSLNENVSRQKGLNLTVVQLFDLCSSILQTLSSAFNEFDPLSRELTNDNYTFPRLQALVLMCAALLLSGSEHGYACTKEAKRFMNLENKNTHPVFLETVSLLARLKEMDHYEAKTVFKSCCFLAPQ